MKWNNVWRQIHLWLGLVAGLVFFTECITGTILVFEDEMTEMLYWDRYYNATSGKEQMAVDEILLKLKPHLMKGEEVQSIKVNADIRKTWEVTVRKKTKNKSEDIGGRRAGGNVLYVNPYTAVIQDRLDPAKPTFFKWVLSLHMSLSMGSIGKTILGVSTFVVLVILVTGIFLWWPKTKKIMFARLKVKWSAKWKRLNYDLHVVLGFYCTFFLIIFLLTSLPWSFKWANDALYSLTNSQPLKREKPKKLDVIVGQEVMTWQQVLDMAKVTLPQAPYWSFSGPRHDTDEVVNVSAANTHVLHRNGFDQVSIDPYLHKVVDISWHQDTPIGWQLRRYMKPVHTGAIGGVITKIIAFAVCLIAASFPVTGVILWYNRLKKVKKGKHKSNLK